MDTKLEREVDVEGTADMMVVEKGEIDKLPPNERTFCQRHEATFQGLRAFPRLPVHSFNVEQFDNLNLKSQYSVSPSYSLRF
jgi:hypothetical protein